MELKAREQVYQRALDEWGEYSQLDQAVEEMAELILAINKYKRTNMDLGKKKDEIMENLIEEIADVKMCIEQLEMMLGKGKVNDMLDKKMDKFLKCFDN